MPYLVTLSAHSFFLIVVNFIEGTDNIFFAIDTLHVENQ